VADVEQFSILKLVWSVQQYPRPDNRDRGSLYSRELPIRAIDRSAQAAKMQDASGQRESVTNRLGEHGGKGFGPMWRNANVLQRAA
jgi:hypothetical protein